MGRAGGLERALLRRPLHRSPRVRQMDDHDEPHPERSVERPSQERALEASGAAHLLSRGEAVAVWALGEAQGSEPAGADDPSGRERLR